jgi:hypothetical protein
VPGGSGKRLQRLCGRPEVSAIVLTWFVTNKDAAPWLAALAAIMAVVSAPLVQRWIALQQQRGSVVSANRVRWIEDFRKDVAMFCELAHHVGALRARMLSAEQARNKVLYEEARREINEKTITLNTIYYHLLLRLNPAKRGTEELRILLQKIDKACDAATVYDEFYIDINDTIDELIVVVRNYLAVEWRKVEELR